MSHVGAHASDAKVREYVRLAVAGLPQMYRSDRREFAQTYRRINASGAARYAAQGTNLRYAAICALGLSRLEREQQTEVLAGMDAAQLVKTVADRAAGAADLGAVALAQWASSEITSTVRPQLTARLTQAVDDSAVFVVDLAWSVTAMAEAARLDSTHSQALSRLVDRLLATQGVDGLFPHSDPVGAQGRWRGHVGCFADQVYPIQALARASGVLDRSDLIERAEHAADAICELQGEAGQWWWHYDARRRAVVEGFPVYSVHQHAMAPMALRELTAAGGQDHRAAIDRGLGWLTTHPETPDDLVDHQAHVIWRKVGRREPKKATRLLNTVVSARFPQRRMPLVNIAFPANQIDHECRPYELGWLLYTWAGTIPRGKE